MDLLYENTDNLMNTLTSGSTSEVEKYLHEHFAKNEPSFINFIDELIANKGLKRQDILIRANLSQKYGYKLLSGETHTTDRDKILRICLSMEMSLKETQRALKLYGMNELYPKIKRDVLLIVAISQKNYDIDMINSTLIKEGETPLYGNEAL